MIDESAECLGALRTLSALGTIRSIKRYRLTLDLGPAVPILPCLDHEAMLHETVDPHVSVYLLQPSGDLHEVILVPRRRTIIIDTVSTWDEYSPAGHEQLRGELAKHFPNHRIRIKEASRWRGDRRVAAACRAQVTLRQVLLGEDLAATGHAVDRLRTIGTLMEKESRVASWGMRTVTGPLLAAVAFLTYQVLGVLRTFVDDTGVAQLRYCLIGALGATFLYYGLKAVQLTGMSNRVWKRAAEYALILEERQRLKASGIDLSRNPEAGLHREEIVPTHTR